MRSTIVAGFVVYSESKRVWDEPDLGGMPLRTACLQSQPFFVIFGVVAVGMALGRVAIRGAVDRRVLLRNFRARVNTGEKKAKSLTQKTTRSGERFCTLVSPELLSFCENVRDVLVVLTPVNARWRTISTRPF